MSFLLITYHDEVFQSVLNAFINSCVSFPVHTFQNNVNMFCKYSFTLFTYCASLQLIFYNYWNLCYKKGKKQISDLNSCHLLTTWKKIGRKLLLCSNQKPSLNISDEPLYWFSDECRFAMISLEPLLLTDEANVKK